MSDKGNDPSQAEQPDQSEEVPPGVDDSVPPQADTIEASVPPFERPFKSAPLEEGISDAGLDYLYADDDPPPPTETNATVALREARIQRLNLGMMLILGALVPAVVIGNVANSYPSLPNWSEVHDSLGGQVDGRLYYLLALLLGKSAFVLANIWLIYQLLRAAERLFIPPEMAKDAQYLLGMKMPQREAPQMLAKQLSEVLTPIKDLLVAVLPGKQDRPGSK